MSYRLDGGAKVGGARRPWGMEPSPDKSQTLIKETEAMRTERETCLSCSLPVCNPHLASCPLRGLKKPPSKRRGSKPLPVPPEYHDLAKGPMTGKEIAAELGVSETTVQRWRRKFGYQRTSIKTKGR